MVYLAKLRDEQVVFQPKLVSRKFDMPRIKTRFAKRRLIILLLICLGSPNLFGQNTATNQVKPTFPVKAFCISAPAPGSIARFNRFIETELAPAGVNTLVLRVDFRFKFKSQPKLIDHSALSVDDVRSLLKTCREQKIQLIPQVNLLGHQSWHECVGKLLEVYPQFDETPNVKLLGKYEWPNKDGLYCKSYCPLHPNVHEVVFACIDEVCDAFEADAFHAGLDEVFFIGHANCSRCAGKSRAELFANEVNKIQKHLASSNRKLWMWGDRLIDGKTTGIGEWEASTNDTFEAIDLISKDIVICDWHYERANKTAVLFASKGFTVVAASWNKAAVAEQQASDMAQFRNDSSWKMQSRYAGMMQTVWESAEGFMDKVDRYANQSQTELDKSLSTVECFKRLFSKMKALETE